MAQKNVSFDEWWEQEKSRLSTEIDATIRRKKVEQETLEIMKELLSVIKIRPSMSDYKE